jgi:hypothetical protein
MSNIKNMTNDAMKMCGFILLTIPSIIYGGYFLLSVLCGKYEKLQLTDYQKSMFRAGHAHAGVIVILSLLIQLFVDHISFPDVLKWSIRISFPLSAVLISLGFFAAAIGNKITQPTKLISILYLGIVFLLYGLVSLGIGLIL